MGFTVQSLSPAHPIVEARFYGTTSAAEVQQGFADCLALALQNDHWPVRADRFREALVQPTDVTAAVSVGFWEVAGINRGLAMKVFRDRDDAIAWLEGSDDPAQ